MGWRGVQYEENREVWFWPSWGMPGPSSHDEGQVSREEGYWDTLWHIITSAAVQAEIKDQIKFQTAGTSIQSPAEVRERNFSSPKSPKIGRIPNRGFGAALKDRITGYCPEARGHGLGLGVAGTGGASLLFPGRVSAKRIGDTQGKAQGLSTQGSSAVSAQKPPFENPLSR